MLEIDENTRVIIYNIEEESSMVIFDYFDGGRGKLKICIGGELVFEQMSDVVFFCEINDEFAESITHNTIMLIPAFFNDNDTATVLWNEAFQLNGDDIMAMREEVWFNNE